MRVEPLLIATRSAGKLRELRELFARAGLDVVDLNEAGVAPSAVEDDLEVADTFEDNALAKARYFAGLTRRAVIADDSGLEVAALGGRPGVRSKRWSGRTELAGLPLDAANNARLIDELRGLTNRDARYVCVAALVDHGAERTFRGTAEGVILEEPRGTEGFGYDPYFFSSELEKTFGEASLVEKEGVSHRGRAFRAL
ncbi:MAG TPA: RdgB/HAM1 family non-canonical purine NTP pyrophosphatase, partial [Gemmatimonadaceae bacterium]|nr:RdgB/HAM1 family non-canonical purine NTP pyrophosphatase [Gemmatimonadaceae bacterium]